MHIHSFEHVPFEGLGMIQGWIEKRNHTFKKTAFYLPSPMFPNLADYDALIVMGGPMGANDETEYPWLRTEKQHIRDAIEAGKLVLGVCLGAQLIASSLGSCVLPHKYKEIGWFPVTVTDQAENHPILRGVNREMDVFHWHSDRFEIPEDALHLMRSAACDHQAFLYRDRVLGLQFHLEMDEAALAAILKACGKNLAEGRWVQATKIIQEKSRSIHTSHALYSLLDNWCNLPKG